MPVVWVFYLFTELYLIIELGSYFGAFTIFIEMIFSAIVGGLILANFSNRTLETVQRVKNGEIKQEEFITLSVFRIVGAILLILPGIITDILGLVLQIELFGAFFANLFFSKIKTPKERHKNQDVIDVEVIG